MANEKQNEIETGKPRKRSIGSRVFQKLLIVGAIAIAGMYGLSLTASVPASLGVVNGTLSACPDKPNCVSTMTDSESHRMDSIDPGKFSSSDSSANPLDRVRLVISENFSRVNLVEEQENYLHFEFTSLIFRFVDDVEFYLDDNGLIQFRSASRVGHSDMGANRKRMTKIIEGLKNE